RAHGRAVGAQDVAAVVYGGALKILTEVSGAVSVRPIACDADWLADHVLLTYDPYGRRHDVPSLLEDLFGHTSAGRYVDVISRLGRRVASADGRCDLTGLAQGIRRYVRLCEEWSGGRFLNADVRRI